MVSALPIRVLRAGALSIDAAWNAQAVCSSYWRCYLNGDTGASIVLESGQRYAITAHTVHLIPAWVGFSCHCSQQVEHWYAHFDVVGWPSALVGQAFPRPIALTDSDVVALAVSTASQHERISAVGAMTAASAVCAASLARAWERCPDTKRRPLATLEQAGPLQGIIGFIDHHLDQPLDNRSLAKQAACSDDHLIRLFRQHLGQTPATYVQERRIAAAAECLLNSSDSIDAIASRYGFANRYHFSRVFAKRLGCPPARYRQRDRV
ncbi:MAG: AraC family transcriptional regulator [Planctomycetota bacterium]|jgi:AraC-like DNA-binding protein|nr:AraC family transcriptional regulator [Planctomycetota bacterium]